jgi:O-antigen/teichoic acid export membrane protein
MSSDSPLRAASQIVDGAPLKEPSAWHLRTRVLSGSLIMLISSGFVGAMNLIYNFVVVHALGADRFGHANAVYTVLLLLASFTLSYQILCSKFVARSESLPEKLGIFRLLHRRAWSWAAGISLALAYSSRIFSGYLNLPNRNYILLIAIANLFYIPLGVQRGLMQGMYNFPRLATNFALEVVVKVAAAALALALGWGVTGVIVAIVASILAAYIHGWPRTQSALTATVALPALQEGIQASVFFIGQMIIYNLDVILVEHFFSATLAGVYAAVAVIGRVVYMLCWSIVNGMFPFSAGVESEERGRAVLGTALLLVVLIATVLTLGAWAAPTSLWHFLLGKGFPLNQGGSYRGLLALYAASTGIWLLAVVIMSYEIARKIGYVSWLQLAFSGAIVAGIYLVHDNLHDVIMVRTVLMIALLLLVSVPFLRVQLAARLAWPAATAPNAAPVRLTKLRRLSEDEVIAEFLSNEFHHPEFRAYRQRFMEVVTHPDVNNAQDNELRRALLYRRRGRLWRELPPDTEWWEVELQSSDLQRIRIFPRNQWRRHADRTYYFLDTAERIRARILSSSSDAFVAKLLSLSAQLAESSGSGKRSAVLLIGLDERSPLTIIEGNHRMTAAALVSPLDVHLRFRFFVGFSPKMMNCCWYQTDFSTLWRYAKNTVTWMFDKPDEVLEQAMQSRAISEAVDSSEAA